MQIAVFAALALFVMPADRAKTAGDFFHDKVITISVGFEVGGGYDVYGRLIARYIGQYIPGRPQVIVQNKTGAGGMVLANSLYNIASKDGLSLGVINQTAALSQKLGDKGVHYDAARFNWIGRMSVGTEVVAVASRTGVRTLEDAKTKQIVMGATGQAGTSSTYPTILNDLMGTKFKVVLGYPGMSATWLAMERGEIDGGSNSWAALKTGKADWLRDKKINILTQVGLTPHPDLPDVPVFADAGKTDLDRTALKLFSAPADIGRALAAPPGVPKERIETLRRAFMAAMHDPALIAEAKKIQSEIEPLDGADLQKIVASSVNVSADAVKRAQQLLSH